jgi:hypothetical protein
MGAQRKEATTVGGLRATIERLGPYQSLALLLVPAGIVEPLKLIAVAVAGDGHWITGTAMIVVAYGASLLLVERLFRIVKPRLLTLPWFDRIWGCFTALYANVFGSSKVNEKPSLSDGHHFLHGRERRSGGFRADD